MKQDKTQFLPLYAQIKLALQEEIEKSMKPGDSLETEDKLEKRFNVSRITIRRALNELEADRLISRQQGRGTFVRELPIEQELPQLLSWSNQMREKGMQPSSSHCEINVVEPTKEFASLLSMKSGEKLVRIRRLRLANGEPICIMDNYIPEIKVPGLIQEGLVNDSLYATLPKYEIKATQAEDRVEARLATDKEAKLLNIHKGSPLIQVIRLTLDSNNNPLYIAVVANRADKFVYTMHFQS